MRKGITPVLAIIMLVIITVGIAGTAYVFLLGVYKGATANAIQATYSSCRNNIASVYIRNIGDSPISLPDKPYPTEPYAPSPVTTLLLDFEDDDWLIEDSSNSNNDGIHHGNTQLLLHLDHNLNDKSINSHSPVLGNDMCNAGNSPCPDWATGKNSNALEFTGSDYVQIPEDPSLKITGPISIEAWVRTDTLISSYQTILMKGSDSHLPSGSFSYALQFNNSNLEFYINPEGDINTSFVISSTMITDSQWHHVVGTYDLSQLKLYIDGQSANTKSETANIQDTSSSLYLGYAANGNGLDGRVDEVAVYSRALSSDEVEEHFNAGRAKFADFAEGPPGFGNALYFDGEDDYLNFSTPSSIFIPSKGSWEMWVKGNFSSQQDNKLRLFCSRDSHENSNYEFRTYRNSQDELGWYLGDGTQTYDDPYTTMPNDNEWTHIAFSWKENNGSTRVLGYHNGDEVSDVTIDSTIYNPDTNINIGAWKDTLLDDHFQGHVAGVRVTSKLINFSEPQQGWFFACEGSDCGGLLVEKDGPQTPMYFDRSELGPGETATLKSYCEGSCSFTIVSGGVASKVGVTC